MNENINNLMKKYILWPELKNDFQKNIHFGRVKMKDFINETSYMLNYKKAIETEISLFYLSNEKLSKSRIESQDILGDSELHDYKQYQETVNNLSKELLIYIIVCSVVEARHATFSDINSSWPLFLSNTPEYNEEDYKDSFFEQLRYSEQLNIILKHPQSQEYFNTLLIDYRFNFSNDIDYQNFVKFTINIASNVRTLLNQGHVEEDNFDRDINMRNLGYRYVAKKFVSEQLHDYSLDKVLTYLVVLFNNENHFTEGYGGFAWADIAQHALSYVQGKINSEVFVDQAFSLEHNNGNMFNKDFIFNKSPNCSLSYTLYHEDYQQQTVDSNSVSMTQILLNAQHLGVITHLFSLNSVFNKLKSYNIDQLYQLLKKDGVFNDFGPDYNADTFNLHYSAIQKNYVELNTHLNKINNYLTEYSPHLVEETPNSYIDFRQLFYTIGKQKIESLFHLANAAHPNNNNRFFTLWNKIHNHYLSNNYKPQDKNIFSFQMFDLNNLNATAFDKNIIGGKAFGLANMNNLGLPVPKGKVFTTACCQSFYTNKVLFSEFLHKILPTFSTYLRDMNHNPVLCSVRSGAPVSMPGMMDTVLNVGIDDSNYDYFCEKLGRQVTNNCIRKFMQLFCSARLNIKESFNENLTENLVKFSSILLENNIAISKNNIFPLNQLEQIEQSLYAVFESWHSERAIAFRNEKHIDHNMGTAAIIQEMVFGNLNEQSCTGVVFSRDCLTGENKLVGEFLPKAQGEDIVSGAVTPFDIAQLKVFNKDIYEQLNTIAKKLEAQTGQIQDIEFTVENGKLYILQHRQAVCAPNALIQLLSDTTLNLDSLFQQIEPKNLQASFTVVTTEPPILNGISANNGVIQGFIVRCDDDMKKLQKQYQQKLKNNPHFGWIFYSELTSPEHMPILSKTHAFITEQGGFTCHAAIIARSLNKPCIVNVGKTNNLNVGDVVTINATEGKIWQGQLHIAQNNHLTKKLANIVIEKNNIQLDTIDKVSMEQNIQDINNKTCSWILKFPQAYYLHPKILKKQHFIDLSSKIALVVTAQQKFQEKTKLKN